MRCIAANRSVLTALDQNATLADEPGNDYTAMTSDIDCMDIIQFADGWYSYPDLNTFDSDLLLDVLTIRNIKLNKIISPWNIRADNPSALPLTEIATRQLEALFNLSQLLFGLARAEQSNYTFRDLQLGQPARRFHEAGFKKFPNSSRSIDYLVVFQLVVNDVVKCGAIDVVFLMYKDPRLRCVKQKCLDLLANVSSIAEVARLILEHRSSFLIQLIQGIRDGHLIEEKIPSLSVLLRLCKVIVERNLLACYQHLIDMQFVDILLDLFENEQYKSNESIIYFIKFESFALQCVHVMLQCAEHVDMWSEKAQIRLVNYCCTLLYKSVLEDEDKHHPRSRATTTNHIICAEQRGVVHSLSSGILTFLSVVRCRKEIGRFYRENEHFRELINVMKQKYSHRSEFIARDPSIACALDQVANVMFERKRRKCQQQSPVRECRPRHDHDQHRKCANSLCQMIENDQIQFEECPHCRSMSYCSNYCREVHWTLTHHLSCSPPVHSKRNDEESTMLCAMDRFPDLSSFDCRNDKAGSFGYASAFETLPVQLPQATVEVTDEITAELAYPSSSSSSSSATTTTEKKKSFKTLLSLLRINKKRK